jgi:hypothetical protein
LRKRKRPDQGRRPCQHRALCQSRRLQKTLIVQNRFIQTGRHQPDTSINLYLIGKVARAAISTATTYLMQGRTPEGSAICRTATPQVWLWLSLLRNGIIRYAGTSRVKE